MLRYTLKEDGHGLVEFSEEYEFTKQYIAFEQLRYEDRLKVEINIDPESFNYELLPFFAPDAGGKRRASRNFSPSRGRINLDHQFMSEWKTEYHRPR